MRLQSKKALVTGAGSHGIGREIALAFAREGADVALHHLKHPDVTAEIAAEIRAMGRQAPIVEADISDPIAGRTMVRDAIRQLGDLDILVANAGVTIRKPFLDFTDAEWDYIHAINLRGAFVCAQEACRHLVARGTGGRIIFVSSANQKQVDPYMAPYCASKGGVMQLAASIAVEMAPKGITCNCVAPGMIVSDLTRNLFTGEQGKRHATRVPMGRVGEAWECAAAAVYFASDESAFVTGSSIYIDGGRHVGAGQSWQVTF
jgi:NAD(P)-dependent dehydrogenase (short-subunit alcohol dehydrogenase family)